MPTHQTRSGSAALLPPSALCTLEEAAFRTLSEPPHKTLVSTLGPAGTSSENTALHLQREARALFSIDLVIELCDSFDEAIANVRDGGSSVALVPNAYPEVATYYMAADLTIVGALVHATPPYGFATGLTEVPAAVSISSHPATLSRIAPLLAEAKRVGNGHVETPRSTVAAAEMAAYGAVDIALTNENAAEQFGLRFITRTEPIVMLWSLFARTERCKRC